MPSSPRATRGQIRALFVARLERLIRLRTEYREDLNPLGLRLLDRAIYATYKDCVDYGAAQTARELMAKHPVPGWDEGLQSA
jgi:hypothetical protein